MHPRVRKSPRVRYDCIPFLRGIKKYMIFFKRIAAREKKFESHQKAGSFENNLLNSNDWIHSHKSFCASGDKQTRIPKGPCDEFYCSQIGLTNRSRVSVRCRRCHDMSLKNSRASQGWASLGAALWSRQQHSPQATRPASEMQMLTWRQMGLGKGCFFNNSIISSNVLVSGNRELWMELLLEPHGSWELLLHLPSLPFFKVKLKSLKNETPGASLRP